jgi:RHS repeat-associated protein
LDGLLVLSTTNAYDTHGRLQGITERNRSGVIAQSTYGYDNLNRLISTTKNGQTQTYDYDSTDQVKTVTGSNIESYTYDKNGNRTNSGYITDAGNRLRSDGTYSYEYDDEGNRTIRTKIADGTVDTYSWDYRNRLMGIVSTDLDGVVTRSVGYTYDVDDQRISKTIDGVVENYYLDGEQIAFVTDGGGHETFHYLYGLNVDQVLAQDSPSGMIWALADRLGSVDTLTDADGNVVESRTYDSFGNLLSSTANSQLPTPNFRYGYTGRELDLESGLDYYRARYYDSAVGRFISVDPMGFGAGDTNLYRYVGNNSTNNTDPSGMIAPLIALALYGAIGGALFAGAYGVADHLERGGSLGNVDWGDVAQKASIGAAVGATFAVGGAFIAEGLVAAGVAASTVQAGGLLFGAAGTGWQAGTGIVNIQNGKPYTGTLDLIGAGLGIWGLNKGYQGYVQTRTTENIARSGVVYDVPGNPRPISQVGDSQLPGGSVSEGGQIASSGRILSGSNPRGLLAPSLDENAITNPSLIPSFNGKPMGKRTMIAPTQKDPTAIRNLNLENDNAELLAMNGYRVNQNPTATELRALKYEAAGTKEPDYIIENRVFDHLKPSSNSAQKIRASIKDKIDEGQTKRIILDLTKNTVNIDTLRGRLTRFRIDELEEVIAIQEDGIFYLYNKSNE